MAADSHHFRDIKLPLQHNLKASHVKNVDLYREMSPRCYRDVPVHP